MFYYTCLVRDSLYFETDDFFFSLMCCPNESCLFLCLEEPTPFNSTQDLFEAPCIETIKDCLVDLHFTHCKVKL